MVGDECASEKTIELIADSSSLNRSDILELQTNHTSLDHHTVRRLQLVQQKPQYFPQRFRDTDSYFAQSGILLCSHWVSSERYAHCCRRNHINRSGTCKLHQFCPYCSYLKGQSLLREFLPSFEKANWHSLTLAFDGNIPFGSNPQDVEAYWSAGAAGLKSILEQKSIRGYYATKELKVNNFMPTRVLPHLHAIVDADQINDGMVEELGSIISRQAGIQLAPDIRASLINSEYSFSKRLTYLYKPLDLVEAYWSGWLEVATQGRDSAPAFNSSVSDFLGLHHTLTYQRKKMIYAGSMHSQFKGYVGIPDAERDEFEEYIRGVQSQMPEYAPDGTAEAL
jgi:hypothetical protein